jgi:hypothetical protein
MALKLEERDGGRTAEVGVQGRLAREDYERLVPEVERLIRGGGSSGAPIPQGFGTPQSPRLGFLRIPRRR